MTISAFGTLGAVVVVGCGSDALVSSVLYMSAIVSNVLLSCNPYFAKGVAGPGYFSSWAMSFNAFLTLSAVDNFGIGVLLGKNCTVSDTLTDRVLGI